MSFETMNLNPKCVQLLTKQGLTEPTPVQAQAIPFALEGRDVVAIAQTGTGKTLGFALPAVTRLAQGGVRKGTQMLVLTPTRELAHQVRDVVAPFGETLGLRTACVYGGVGMEPQTKALRRGVDIVIATPGRLLDHIERRNADFRNLSILVMDEADRMLDMGFMPDIKRILGVLPTERQTMMFSATFPRDIARLTAQFLHDPERVEIAPQSTAAESVTQNVYTVDSNRKMELLQKLLAEKGMDSALIFMRTKHRTDRVTKQLNRQGFKAQAIHGGRSQSQRQKALDGFRKGRYSILVATDVAARGIDVDGISHVVNFDVPKEAGDYIHRIGRTGRANAVGDAITFVAPEDFMALGAIEKALGRNLPRADWEGAVNVRTTSQTAKQGRPKAHGARSARPQRKRRLAARR